MKNRTSILFVEDILISMRKIQRYISGLDFKAFEGSELLIDALVRNLEIIGEASRAISDEIRAQWPDIPWHLMIGLRNVVIHRYFEVDLEGIWRIVHENIPETLPKIEEMLKKLEAQEKEKR